MSELQSISNNHVHAISAAADHVAARHVFDDYKARKARNTLRRQHNDLTAFATYLAEIQITVSADDLQNGSEAWNGISWGIVAGFVRWMLQSGYAVSSANVRLSTVKTYVGLAFQVGAIPDEQHALIRSVHGYQRNESRHIDEERVRAGTTIRKGAKKAAAVTISEEIRRKLKREHPDTPQGRRDALLMCLLLDHGLRCGELALLQVSDIVLEQGELRFYRPKVDKAQTHRLSPDTLRAARAWFERGDVLESGALLRSTMKSKHGNKLHASGMSERAITKRVEYLGRRFGVTGLSAHDGRHSWATTAARNGTDPFALQEAGGWSSLAMPRRYVEAAKIANEGVKID
jgi:integrase